MTFPNQLSLLRLVLAPLFLVLYLSEGALLKEIAIIIFFLAVLTDWYDGLIARKYGMVSRLGIFLDPLADKVLTSFAFILFYILGFMPFWMLAVIVIRDISITLLRSYHETKGLTLETSYAAKVKTFVQMTYIITVLLVLFVKEIIPDNSIILSLMTFLQSDINTVLLLFITLITLYTGVQYLFSTRIKKSNEIR